MLIKACAFQYELPKWVEEPIKFYRYVANLSDETVDHDLPQGKEPQRFLRVIVGRGISYGLNIFVRDQSAFYQLITEHRKPKQVKRLDARGIIEFNFFFIRHDTGAGIFTQYNGCATSFDKFRFLLNRRFRSFRDDSQAQQPGRKLKGLPKFSRICRRKQWDEELAEKDAALSMRIRYKVVNPLPVDFRPPDFDTETFEYTFKKERRARQVAASLKAWISKKRVARASIRARGKDGHEETIQIGSNLEVFDRWEYDVDEELDIHDFRHHEVLTTILEHKDSPILVKVK